MTNAPLPSDDGTDPAAGSAADARTPAHRARKVAAAVSAGAFAGIAIGLLATHAGADDDPGTVPTGADAIEQPSPFGQFGGGATDQFGGGSSDESGGQDLDGDGRTGDPGDFSGDGGSTDQFAPPSSDGATPSPFGGQSAPDTNSGGS